MVDEAITPSPKKEETTTSMEEATTSEKPKGEPTPSSEDKKVVELESEVDGLKKQLKQAQDLQRQADRKARVEAIEKKKIENTLNQIKSGEIGIEDETPVGETSTEREIRLNAKNQIMSLILDNSDYQELLEKDLTLKEVLRNNPFVLIGDYLDAQDAAEQVKEKLDERVSSLKAEKKKNQSEEETEKKGEGKEFEAGFTQPKESSPAPSSTTTPLTPDEKLEESIKSKIEIT